MRVHTHFISPVTACAFGAALLVYLPESALLRFAAAAAGVFMAAAFFTLARQKTGLRASCVAALCLGLLLGAAAQRRNESARLGFSLGFAETGSIAALEGCIVSDPRRTKTGLLGCEVELEAALGMYEARARACGRVAVYVRPDNNDYAALRYLSRGAHIRVAVPKLSVEAQKRMVFVNEAAVTTCVEANAAERFRNRIRASLIKALHTAGGDSGPLLAALIVGVRDDLDTALADDFRQAGCAHILALSGQHVAILAGLISVCIGFALGPYRARALSCVLALAYMYIVGASPSVLRAVIMFIVSAWTKASDRPQPLLCILSASFIFALCAAPQSVHSVSFQLSYAAVLGIALVQQSYEFTLKRWLPFAATVATGFSALAASAPLSLVYFGTLNVLAPITSALAGAMVTALMWAGLAGAALTSLVPALRSVSAFVCGIVYRTLSALIRAAGIFNIVHIVESSGGARLTGALCVVFAAALLYAWPYARYGIEKRHRAAAYGGYTPPRKLRLTFGIVRAAFEPQSRHAKKIRPELFNKPERAKTHRRAVRHGKRLTRVGNRPGDGRDEL